MVAHKNSKMEQDFGDVNERIVAYQNYLTSADNVSHVRVSKLALTTVAMFAEMHDTSVVLADVPQSL